VYGLQERRLEGILKGALGLGATRMKELQQLPFSSAYYSPATTILQRLPFSSDYHSPAPAILQRLPFSGHYISLATTFLQSLFFGVSIPLVPELRASHKRACHGLPTPSPLTLVSL
jgi:hypothetical protein